MRRTTWRATLPAALLMAVLIVLGAASVRAQAADLYPTDQWHAQYWENTELSGAPASTGSTNAIHYRWGLDRPLAGQDTFSVRWTRRACSPAACSASWPRWTTACASGSTTSSSSTPGA